MNDSESLFESLSSSTTESYKFTLLSHCLNFTTLSSTYTKLSIISHTHPKPLLPHKAPTMSSFTYHHTRTRSRERERVSPPPLPRRTSFKRQRLFASDDEDDGYDDYPYAGNHKPSRALVKRDRPSQLERWNIWSDSRKEERCDSAAEDDERERRRSGRRRVSFADDLDEDDERAFRLRVATLSSSRHRQLSPPPRRHHAESDDERVRPHVWSAELFRRRERCVSEDYEARERERSRSRERRRRDQFWGDDDDDVEREFDGERVVRWRRIKRTRTDEWRPLTGWRRA